MSVTILASLFLLFMLLVTWFGYRFVIRRESDGHQGRMQRCTICRGDFPSSQLIERSSGDSRVHRFCERCV